MPEWLPTLLDVVPQIGIAGFLAWLLLRVWDRSSTDRSTYEADRDAAQQRYQASLEAAQQRYEREITRLRQLVDDLNVELDAERAARRAAQDEAARRRIGGEG